MHQGHPWQVEWGVDYKHLYLGGLFLYLRFALRTGLQSPRPRGPGGMGCRNTATTVLATALGSGGRGLGISPGAAGPYVSLGERALERGFPAPDLLLGEVAGGGLSWRLLICRGQGPGNHVP